MPMDAARLREITGLAKHVTHQDVVFLVRRPFWLRTFVGVADRRARFRSEADCLLEILRADLGLARGQCALNPDSFTPAFSHARFTRYGSSSIDTLWKYPASLNSSRPRCTIGSTYS